MAEQQTVEITQEQYIVVKFDGEQFGINIKYVYNIIRNQRMTRVPNAPDHIKGVINLRGEIVPVMSLRKKFDLADDEITNKTRIIIVKLDQQSPMGILVDEIREVVELESSDIEKKAYDENEGKAAYLLGVGKYENELVSLLDLSEVLSEKQIEASK